MHPNVPIREARSLRILVMHEYFRTEPEILWDTMVSDIPELARMLGAAPPAQR